MEEDTQTISSGDVANVDAASLASGDGAAHDASIKTEDNVGRLQRELAEAYAAENAAQPQRRIDAAQRAVDKAKEALAGAEDALRQAHADNEAEAAGYEAAVAEKADRRAAAQAEAEAAAAAEQEGN